MNAKDFIAKIIMLGMTPTSEINTYRFKSINVHFAAELDYKEIDLLEHPNIHIPDSLLNNVINFMERPDDYT